jgi:transcriptional regulator with XRE-family HTH domain
MDDYMTPCAKAGRYAELGGEMTENPRMRKLARELRAARVYADMSRLEIGNAVGYSDETIGRWERGEWDEKRPGPRAPVLAAIAKVTGIPDAYMSAGFLSSDDPATRFADVARLEARRPRGRQRLKPGGRAGEGAAGEDG